MAPRAVFIVLCLTAAAARAGDARSPSEPLRLFNGKDLSGFYTWLQDTKRDDPRGVFTVTDAGLLRISGDGFGYLSTRQSFRNYRLVVEFKWGTRNWRGREGKARDSGIFLHSAGPDGNSLDGNGAYKAAVECQIMQGAVGDLMLINGRRKDGSRVPVRLTAPVTPRRDADGWPTWHRGGQPVTLEMGGRLNWFAKDAAWRDVLDFRGRRDVESPPQEWTRIECVCDGNRITVLVNGVVVNEATKVSPSEGPILLQCEGSEIYFRTVELHPLGRASCSRPDRAQRQDHSPSAAANVSRTSTSNPGSNAEPARSPAEKAPTGV